MTASLQPSSPDKIRVDIWSDIACPWCYVGKRRLESALAQFQHRDQVEVVWHSFELDPTTPRTPPEHARRTGPQVRPQRRRSPGHDGPHDPRRRRRGPGVPL
ncbi:DsbA family protein [Deinococcus caeni]|uniref:DsbA family protein n=1 Tax=Deinococcus caeni TaxID=569127 RepID=UPI0036174E1E